MSVALGPPYELLDLTLVPPGMTTMPRIIGAGLSGGRALDGTSQTIDITGGGFVAIDYTKIQLGNAIPQNRLRYFSNLTKLNGSVRSIIVPLLTDGMAPVNLGMPPSASFSDGSFFSDGSGFTDSGGLDIISSVTANAALNATTVHLKVAEANPLQGGEWFGVLHPTKSNRAYLVTDVVSASGPDLFGYITYVLNIRPPLRDTITAGDAVDFWRPKCVMRLAPGSEVTAEISQFWYSTPDIHLVESFP